MNCPRCTHDLPDGSRFCPACGLNLEQVSEEAAVEEEVLLESEKVPEEGAPAPDEDRDKLWPQWLAIQSTRSPKKPGLAATLGFLFGPFTYLYLEQPAWFWWGLLGGILLSILSRGELVFVLHIGGMLHGWDVARMLNEDFDTEEFEAIPAVIVEEESA